MLLVADTTTPELPTTPPTGTAQRSAPASTAENGAGGRRCSGGSGALSTGDEAAIATGVLVATALLVVVVVGSMSGVCTLEDQSASGQGKGGGFVGEGGGAPQGAAEITHNAVFDNAAYHHQGGAPSSR